MEDQVIWVLFCDDLTVEDVCFTEPPVHSSRIPYIPHSQYLALKASHTLLQEQYEQLKSEGQVYANAIQHNVDARFEAEDKMSKLEAKLEKAIEIYRMSLAVVEPIEKQEGKDWYLGDLLRAELAHISKRIPKPH